MFVLSTIVIALMISNVILIVGLIRLNNLLKPLKEQQNGLAKLVQGEVEKLEGKLHSQINTLELKQDQIVLTLDIELRKAIASQRLLFKEEFEKEKEARLEYLKKQTDDFKVLMDKEYLNQYEKMKKSPPRPRKGPRKKDVQPPQKYRSLDDE